MKVDFSFPSNHSSQLNPAGPIVMNDCVFYQPRGHRVKLTNRDIGIIKFINNVGYCTPFQLRRRLKCRIKNVYKIVGRLIDAGLVRHQRIYHDKPGIYYLTSAGARHSPLPAIDRVSKGIYDHQIKLVDLMIKLQERYPDTEWVTDRYLVQQKFYYGVGRGGHVADGLLIFPDERKVAIELELSVKGKRRLATRA